MEAVYSALSNASNAKLPDCSSCSTTSLFVGGRRSASSWCFVLTSGPGGAPCSPTKRNSTYHSNFESARQPHVNNSLESHNTPESHVPKSAGQALASFFLSPQIAHLDGKSAKGASNHQDVDDCFQGELHCPRQCHETVLHLVSQNAATRTMANESHRISTSCWVCRGRIGTPL
jgi:hypothetical protein